MEEQKIMLKAKTEDQSEDVNSDAAKGISSEMRKMLESAVHFGHRKTKQNPKMKPYVFGVRNNVSIIDLEQTQIKLKEAANYMKKAIENGKVILFVDTRPSTREETKALAEDLGMPYVTERWSGGTITNWKTISLRLEHLKDLEAKMKSEEWNKYTKKERHDMEEEAKKQNILWGGIKNMTNIPDVVFVVDMQKNILAIKEAHRRNIPIVAIADTNVNPEYADYPIPANDDALSSVKYILNKIKKTIKGKGKSKK